MSDLVERLRHAHAHSQQRVLGSNIFKEAADRIATLEAELQKAREDFLTMGGKFVQAKLETTRARGAALEEAATEVDLVVRNLGYMPNCTYLCAVIRALSQDKE